MQMTLVYDNQEPLHIDSKLAFHVKIKHIEVDNHFIKENIVLGDSSLALSIPIIN